MSANQVPQWLLCRQNPHREGVRHVVPISDLFEHVIDGSACWCNARLVEVEGRPGGLIVSHNSADDREQYEPAARPITH